MSKTNKHNRGGYVLLAVLAVVIVLSIMSVSLFTMTQSNNKQVVFQEKNLRAHYLARSGIDIAYAAMMTEYQSTGTLKIHRLIQYNNVVTQNNLALPQTGPIGKVDVRVSYDSVAKEVAINAISRLDEGVGTYDLTLFIKYDSTNPSDFTKTRWSNN